MQLYRKRTNELVELPAELADFRGQVWTVEGIVQDSGPGSSGKVGARDEFGRGRTFFPTVFETYIADEPEPEPELHSVRADLHPRKRDDRRAV